MNSGFTSIGVTVYDHLNISQSLDLIGYTGESLVFLSISHSDKQVPVVFGTKVESVEDSISIYNYNNKTKTTIHNKQELYAYIDNINLVTVHDKESVKLQKYARKHKKRDKKTYSR